MSRWFLGILCVSCFSGTFFGKEKSDDVLIQEASRNAFKDVSRGGWKEIFFDSCTGEWTDKWFLDGEIAAVSTGPEGMQLMAGPRAKNDAHSMVLWTKESFSGDLKIEYEYTRLDFSDRYVNILYIEATGSGAGPYVKDITGWNELRRVPSMSMYFDHMNTYHISYAAYGGDGTVDYIRARRYMPERTGLEGTELTPDYYPPPGLFAPGVLHKFTVIKKDRDIYLRIENPDQVFYGHMTNTNLPVIAEGRVGLRHMFTRSACYKDFRISVPE